MYKRNSIKKLGKKKSHREALIKNLLRSIMLNGKVTTSSVRAKVLRGELESVFSKIKGSKDGDIQLLRELLRIFGTRDLANKALELGKKDSSKITLKKYGFRAGDNTQTSVVEIEGFKVSVQKKKKVETEKKEERKVEEPKEVVEEKRKGILNLGRKSVSKKVEPIKKERARTRSGL